MTTPTDVHELQHHGGHIRVEFDEVDSFICEAQPVDAHQVPGVSETFGPDFDLPDFLKRWNGRRRAALSAAAVVFWSFAWNKRKRTKKKKHQLKPRMKPCVFKTL